jgi:cold shock CspA family protein/ribosome-associated translation inhibitor RaiA
MREFETDRIHSFDGFVLVPRKGGGIMQLPVEISFRNMDRSETLTADIQAKANKLGSHCDRITHCSVILEALHHQHRRGSLYRARIHLSVPNRELTVDRESHDRHQQEDPHAAVHDAFESISRQLKSYVREQRGDTKLHEVPPHGRIAKICLPEGSDYPERGFGFISTSDGREVYFHANSLVDVAFPQLEVGSEVRFVEESGDDGPQAASVRLVGKQYHLVD